MIKPDGVSRGLVGKIITKFEEKGLKLKDLKLINPSEEILRDHYKDHVEKSFFQSLLSYMTSGPVVAMVTLFISFSFNHFLIYIFYYYIDLARNFCCKSWKKFTWCNKSS